MSKLYDILNSLITRVKKVETNTPDLAQNDPTQPDYIKNRTHYEETTVVNEPLNITWDGNTEGLVSVKGAPLYKVSDVVPNNDEQIKTATLTASSGFTLYIGDMWEGMVSSGRVTDDGVVTTEGLVAFIRKDNTEIMGVVFPSKGIYFVSINGTYVASLTTTEPVEQTKTVVHKLDKKWLPEQDAEIIFTGVMNADGWYDYTCNKSYAEARAELEKGATARMIQISGTTMYHLTLDKVLFEEFSTTLNFFRNDKTIEDYSGVIKFEEDGTIGGGLE